MHHDGVVVHPAADQSLDLGAAQYLGQHRRSVVTSTRPWLGCLLDPQPAVTVHRLGDVDQQAVGHRVAAVGEQGVDHLLGVMPGGPGVPQAERSQSVGVDVLRRPLQLGEGRDGDPARVGGRMIDLEQQSAVGLTTSGPGAEAGPRSLAGGGGVGVGPAPAVAGELVGWLSGLTLGDSVGVGVGVGVRVGVGQRSRRPAGSGAGRVTSSVDQTALWLGGVDRLDLDDVLALVVVEPAQRSPGLGRWPPRSR